MKANREKHKHMISISAHKLLLARNILGLPEDTRGEIITWLVRVYSQEQLRLCSHIISDLIRKDETAGFKLSEMYVNVRPNYVYVALFGSKEYPRGCVTFRRDKIYRRRLHRRLAENLGDDKQVIVCRGIAERNIIVGPPRNI